MSSFQKLTVKELKVLKITPKMAEEFLKNNKINRHIRPGLVNKYSYDMIKGRWQTIQNISFDSSGSIIDGQNRLSAIVKSKIACDFIVAYYNENTTALMNPFDTGGTRNVSDITNISPKIVQVLSYISKRFINSNDRPEIAISNLVEKLPVDSTSWLEKLSTKTIKCASSAPVRAALFVAYVCDNMDWSNQYNALVQGVGMNDNTQIMLRKLGEYSGAGEPFRTDAFGIAYMTILSKNKKISSYRKDTIMKYYNLAKKEILSMIKD
jgi:hypothetical protein